MTSSLTIGSPAPAFDLDTDGGESASLKALKGRNIVLYFYPKDDTSGCTQEALDFEKLRPEFGAANTEIIGVSPDSVESHAKFRAKHGFGLTLAADPEHGVLEAYGVWGEKSMYGRKYMGVLRTTVLIDGAGRVARVWDNVKVAGHAEEVLAAAQALPAA
jgi:peroxiredoxin Q/BCP